MGSLFLGLGLGLGVAGAAAFIKFGRTQARIDLVGTNHAQTKDQR